MKPANFPEKERLRKVRALMRAGLPVPQELTLNQRARRTKKDRSHRAVKKDG